jgi:hypothetical protein
MNKLPLPFTDLQPHSQDKYPTDRDLPTVEYDPLPAVFGIQEAGLGLSDNTRVTKTRGETTDDA